MRYISTRGYAGKDDDETGVGFFEAMRDGLAPDGGLYLPTSWPQFKPADFIGKSFPAVAEMVMAPFVAPDVSQTRLQALIEKAYSQFNHPDVTPMTSLSENHHQLELFHGPTLAFKDVALQMLGVLLDEALAQTHQNITVLGATSGDTGPAAIEGLKGRSHVQTFMLFPAGRVSEVQRRQMTTRSAENVHPIAVAGTFDDCQKLVKAVFHDDAFRQRHQLTAINSISWARLLPQMVYYFYAYGQLAARHNLAGKRVSFSVPTGNFGDVFAGYMAKKCGLPLGKLIVATNMNDILTRFVHQGDYSNRGVYATQSPSMDISVASNFERYLFELHERDAAKLREVMAVFEQTNALPALSEEQLATVQQDFAAYRADEAATTRAMTSAWQAHHRLVDPHTAVGLHGAWSYLQHHPHEAVVTLATAHPAKFADAVNAATGETPELPERLQSIMQANESYAEIAADVAALKGMIARQASA